MKRSTIIALIIYAVGVFVCYHVGKAERVQFNRYLINKYHNPQRLEWSQEDRVNVCLYSLFSWASAAAFTVFYYYPLYGNNTLEYKKANW